MNANHMKFTLMYIKFVAILLICTIPQVSSLKCYECLSVENENCISNYTSFLIDCTKQGRAFNAGKSPKDMICRKVETKVQGSSLPKVIRYCAWLTDEDKKNAVFKTNSVSGDVKANYRTCDTDACNIGIKTYSYSQNTFVLLLSTLIIPLMLLFSFL